MTTKKPIKPIKLNENELLYILNIIKEDCTELPRIFFCKRTNKPYVREYEDSDGNNIKQDIYKKIVKLNNQGEKNGK